MYNAGVISERDEDASSHGARDNDMPLPIC